MVNHWCLYGLVKAGSILQGTVFCVSAAAASDSPSKWQEQSLFKRDAFVVLVGDSGCTVTSPKEWVFSYWLGHYCAVSERKKTNLWKGVNVQQLQSAMKLPRKHCKSPHYCSSCFACISKDGREQTTSHLSHYVVVWGEAWLTPSRSTYAAYSEVL